MAELLKNDPLRMAGATAFFTTFALPPILVILIQVLKLVLDPVRVRDELFRTLSGIVGPEAISPLTNVLERIRDMALNWWITIGGFIFLVFVATTLFKVIRNSLNQVWKVRQIQKSGFYKSLAKRAKAVAVILVAGILFLVGIMAEGLRALIGHYIFEFSPILSGYMNSAMGYIISILITQQ